MSNPTIIGGVVPQAPPQPQKTENPRPATVLSSADINHFKRRFLDCCLCECPDFEVRPEYRSILSGIVLWCLGVTSGPYDIDKGLWLYGNIGTGKSTLLRAIDRFWPILHTGTVMRTTPATRICAAYQDGGYEAVGTYIFWRVQGFDDLGQETIPTGHFGTPENVMSYLLHSRYDRRSRQLTLVTTNIGTDQIAEYYGAAVFDRAKQMFNFIPMEGATFRK